MKQLLKTSQGQKDLGISLLALCIAGVVALQAPLMVSRIIMCLVIASVGIIGAVKVHRKMKSGAADLQATAMNWFGSFLVLMMANTILFSVFVK
ncbi:MAG: DUF4134 domain-containing protein [Arcicella sp.]|jgi:hypothetical protein|nr:DUF4134 domain-containing protein [Arcicella sp.]